MRILIIEDDRELRQALQKALTDESFVVDTADNGEGGSYTARTNHYDLILLDYLLPGKNGDTVCKELRALQVHVPILLMSIKTSTLDKVNLLESGADDYLCKPFSISELLARMRALMRRPYKIEQTTFSLDDLTINRSAQEVSVAGERVYFTKKEYMLLDCMAQKCGQVVTRAHIIETVWDNEADPFSNTIEAHVRNVRKKIEEKHKKRYIHTIPGRGYKLDINK